MFIYNYLQQNYKSWPMNREYPTSNYSPYSHIKNDYKGLTAEQGRIRNSDKACAEVRYYDPYERLIRRRNFQIFLRQKIKDPMLNKLDYFVIFDAVAKRGGYQQVCKNNRWEEICISTQYEKNVWSWCKYYPEFLVLNQTELINAFPFYRNQSSRYLNSGVQLVEMHLLNSNLLTSSYYQLVPLEQMFAQNIFFSLDEYFNLKTLALYHSQISKIPIEYADKFMIMRKWLILYSQSRQHNQLELRTLAIADRIEDCHKVIIVGMAITSLLIADKLSDFGIRVTIIENTKRQNKTKDDFQMVENGLILLEGGRQSGSYYSHLLQANIQIQQFHISNVSFIQDQNKICSQERLRLSEEHFIGLLEELKGQNGNKKNLYEQLMNRMIRRKLQHERALIKWHYDRYLMFNRIKGDCTTVADMLLYQKKKILKHIPQNHVFGVIGNVERLIDRLKEKKNVNLVRGLLQNGYYHNSQWTVSYKSQQSTLLKASHLIYCDSECISRCLQQSNYKIPELTGEFIGQGFNILQQFVPMKYINCLFKFKDKVILKDYLKGNNAFSINWTCGSIFYFILNNGCDIIGTAKCYSHSNINYYTEILGALQYRCLQKGVNKLISDQIYAYEYAFGIKDEKFIQRAVRVRESQKMFFNLPITSTNCPHRMQAQMDMCHYMCGIILQQQYPDLKQYDQSVRNHFYNPDAPSKLHQIKLEGKIASISEKKKQQKKEDKRQDKRQDKREDKKQDKRQDKKQDKKHPKQSPITLSPSYLKFKQNSDISNRLLIRTVMLNQQKNIQKIIESDLLTIFSLYRLCDDCFGLKHPYVRSHQNFIKYRLQNAPKNSINAALMDIQTLDLSEPVWLYPTVVLNSLGQPLLEQKSILKQILQQEIDNRPQVLLLNNFITRREFFSLEDTFRTTTYYQSVMLIQNHVLYIMIDESNGDVYYHNDLNALIDRFNERIIECRSGQNEMLSKKQNNSKVIRNKIKRYPPAHFLHSLIKSYIEDEIKRRQTIDFNLILEEKLEKRLKFKKINKFMGSEYEIQIEEETFQLQSYFSNPAESLYYQLNTILLQLLRIYEIRKFSLFQIFFGHLNQQYMACEIMKKGTQQALSYPQLQKLDYQLCQELKEVFSKGIRNEEFALFIVPDQYQIVTHRNFLNLKSCDRGFERYTYLKQLQIQDTVKNLRHYMILSGEKIEFNNQQDIMKMILSKLLLHYKTHEIVQKFRTLFQKDLNAEVDLLPRLRSYYRMTKKHFYQQPNRNEINYLLEKCSNLSQEHRKLAYNLMKNKEIQFFENEFIYIVS